MSALLPPFLALPRFSFMTAVYKAALLLAIGHSSELGLNYPEPWLAWGLHNHRTTNTAQRCSVYLRDVSLARLPGTTARNQCKNNKEFTHPMSILETVHNPYICFLCFSKSSWRKSTTELYYVMVLLRPQCSRYKVSTEIISSQMLIRKVVD